MNEKPIDQMNDDELALHIAKLESQPLVAALQELQPQSSARDLFELGFAAGEQAQAARVQLPDHRDFVGRWTWAAISSAVSVAATVMIMIPMAPMLERSSSRHIAEAVQPKRELLQPQGKPALVRDIASQPAAFDLEGALAELERRSGIEGTATPAGLVDAKPTIVRESLRYVAQRRAWISELSSELQ